MKSASTDTLLHVEQVLFIFILGKKKEFGKLDFEEEKTPDLPFRDTQLKKLLTRGDLYLTENQ